MVKNWYFLQFFCKKRALFCKNCAFFAIFLTILGKVRAFSLFWVGCEQSLEMGELGKFFIAENYLEAIGIMLFGMVVSSFWVVVYII